MLGVGRVRSTNVRNLPITTPTLMSIVHVINPWHHANNDAFLRTEDAPLRFYKSPKFGDGLVSVTTPSNGTRLVCLMPVSWAKKRSLHFFP
jgi:hypothetical protein